MFHDKSHSDWKLWETMIKIAQLLDDSDTERTGLLDFIRSLQAVKQSQRESLLAQLMLIRKSPKDANGLQIEDVVIQYIDAFGSLPSAQEDLMNSIPLIKDLAPFVNRLTGNDAEGLSQEQTYLLTWVIINSQDCPWSALEIIEKLAARIAALDGKFALIVLFLHVSISHSNDCS